MNSHRARVSALIAAVTAGVLLLSGCGGTSALVEPTTSGSAASDSAAAETVLAPANAREFALPAGSGTVAVELWTDPSCPHCKSLDEEVSADLAQWTAAGDVAFTIHPLNFVSAKRGDTTDWSTRAANALAAVVDAGQADRLPRFYSLLQENQVTQEGALADEQIIDLAKEAGVTADITDAVTSLRFGPWVQASNDHWMGRTISGTEQVVQGVPILVIDGKVFEIREDGTDGERVREAVTAALAA